MYLEVTRRPVLSFNYHLKRFQHGCPANYQESGITKLGSES